MKTFIKYFVALVIIAYIDMSILIMIADEVKIIKTILSTVSKERKESCEDFL